MERITAVILYVLRKSQLSNHCYKFMFLCAQSVHLQLGIIAVSVITERKSDLHWKIKTEFKSTADLCFLNQQQTHSLDLQVWCCSVSKSKMSFILCSKVYCSTFLRAGGQGGKGSAVCVYSEQMAAEIHDCSSAIIYGYSKFWFSVSKRKVLLLLN